MLVLHAVLIFMSYQWSTRKIFLNPPQNPKAKFPA